MSPAIVESRGAPRQDRVFAAELNLDRLSALSTMPASSAAGHGDAAVRVRALPRHPFVVRDLSIVVADALPAEIIRGTIQRVGTGNNAAPLVAVRVFDLYKGKGLPEGTVSLSLRLTFQAPDRTLTDAEVQDSFDKILRAVVTEHGAVQR